MTRIQTIFALIAAAALLAVGITDADAQTLAETRALCQKAHDRRFPKDAGPDDAGEFYEWDRLQSILNDSRGACLAYLEARQDFFGKPATSYTIQDLKDLLATCNDAIALAELARAVLKADKAACSAAATSLACTNGMGYPGECVSDGGTDGGP